MNQIKALQAFGQSVWLDDLRRGLFTSGEFRRLIIEDGVRGVTSNPSIFEKIFGTAEWRRLAAAGAHPQRLLWASTSTKNPEYRDVRYVEELIGRDTVSTITPATIETFRAHGRPRASLEEHLEQARHTLGTLERVGISLEEVTDTLAEVGVMQFSAAFDTLLTGLHRGR
jgi:transaldolase / glucose-6-phosphate isomerase